MKIKKISEINNAFSYSYFNWDKINPAKGNKIKTPDDVFKKNNIFYAENANGKTNIIKIFKSLNGQDIEIRKHWDLQKDPQKIEILLEKNSKVVFNGDDWTNSKLNDIFYVFDKKFIEQYVHSIGTEMLDTAQRRQQRGRNIIYLGNFGAYNKEIDKVNSTKNLIRDKNKQFLENERIKISNLLKSVNMTYQDLEKNRSKIKVLNKSKLVSEKEELSNNEIKLKDIEKAINEKDKIDELSELSKIQDTFSLTVTVVLNDKKKKVIINPNNLFSFTVSRGVQETLKKIEGKKGFIEQGLSLIENNINLCPFCEQLIKNGDYIKIIKDYQKIFDEAFALEEKKVQSSLNKYKHILQKLKEIQPPLINSNRLNNAKNYLSNIKDLPQVEINMDNKNILNHEITLVQEKEKKLLDKMDGSLIEKLKYVIELTNNTIKQYNEIVDKNNVMIRQLKKDATEGKLEIKKKGLQKEIKKLETKIFYLDNLESFHNYFNATDIYKSNEKIADSLERIYQTLKEKIISKFKEFVSEYFDLIKGFVKELCPSMDIFDICGEANYDRRNIKDPAQCGFKVIYNEEDCTKTLSEGEKQVIAMAFFFAQLRKENDPDKIIILDDPITSFDAGKRKSTTEVTERETAKFTQMFMFTCDPLFREFCRKQFKNRNLYYIFKTQRSSSIHYIPKKRETIYSSFETDFKNIDTYDGSNENIVVFGQKLRFCLETKIKEDYFGYSQESLTNMIETFTGKGKVKLENLINNKDVILQIYNYCSTGGLAHYPKDGPTSWNELKSKIKQYLELKL